MSTADTVEAVRSEYVHGVSHANPVTRHTADMTAATYTRAQELARDEYGLSLAEMTRGLYRLFLDDPALLKKAAQAAQKANAELKRVKRG